MRSQLAFVLFLVVDSKSLVAQSGREQMGTGPRSVAAGVSAPAAICDGSEMRRARYRGEVGNGVLFASLALGVFAVSANHGTPGRAIASLGAGLGVAAVGVYLHWTARPSDSFWKEIIAQARPGETSSRDVERCLREPDAKSASLADETWTYFLRRPVFEGPASSEYRSVSFTFKDSLLVNVRRTDARVPNDGRVVVQPPPIEPR